MSWDPVLKKKLLNEYTCGSRKQCTGPIKKNASTGKRASQTDAKFTIS